eukprot:m.131419 g.131419  ORF g.131419 m.131419 type:complete len:66 (+) comp13915_c0_seq1:7855-8052(+)
MMRTDNTGLGADWHLDYILVRNTSSGEEFMFRYSGWFSKKAGLSKELVVDSGGPVASATADSSSV